MIDYEVIINEHGIGQVHEIDGIGLVMYLALLKHNKVKQYMINS
jgi:hypothetical protein